MMCERQYSICDLGMLKYRSSMYDPMLRMYFMYDPKVEEECKTLKVIQARILEKEPNTVFFGESDPEMWDKTWNETMFNDTPNNQELIDCNVLVTIISGKSCFTMKSNRPGRHWVHHLSMCMEHVECASISNDSEIYIENKANEIIEKAKHAQAEWENILSVLYPDKSDIIVTLCGSLRFKDTMIQAFKGLTAEGYCVLTPAIDLFSKEELTSEILNTLDRLHEKKLMISSYAYIINVDGYIGEDTMREYMYARDHHMGIRLYNPNIVTSLK